MAGTNPEKVNYEALLNDKTLKIRDIRLPDEAYVEGLDSLGRDMNRGGAERAFYDGWTVEAFGDDDPLTQDSQGWAADVNRLTATGTAMWNRLKEVIKYNKTLR